MKPDSITFGEVVEPPSLQRSFAGRMDGTLDFLLHQALRNFFAYNQLTASQFNAFLQRYISYFPKNFILPSFLDNHDMNRFLWVMNGDVPERYGIKITVKPVGDTFRRAPNLINQSVQRAAERA